MLTKYRWLCFLLGAILSTGQVMAACPPSSQFFTKNKVREDVPVSPTDLSVNQGAYSATMDFVLPLADIPLTVSSLGIAETVTVSVQKRVWRLTVPTRSGITKHDLRVSYQMIGNDGAFGKLTSRRDASSHVAAQVNTRIIDQRIQKKKTRLRGFIDVTLDLSGAKRSGKYSGRLIVTVDCI